MRLSDRQQAYLHLMGIDTWFDRDALQEKELPDELNVSPESGMSNNPDWELLRKEVETCTRCPLHQGRTHAVFGTGSESADWMLIGEAPGAEEDRQGKPFVGRAGKLLTSMLNAIGMQREQVYIANILKCRPPGNRDPAAEEVACCEEYLKRQIMHIRPKIIIALGRIAAQNLLNSDTPIGKMRGRLYEYGDPGIPVIVTYHPAYLLRSPREKRKSWQDLKAALQLYKEVS